MRIGIDLHKTIDSNPEYFLKVLKDLYINDYEVVIISGSPAEEIKKELDRMNFKHQEHYHGVLSVVDFLKNEAVKMWQDENGNWWCDENIWWKSKARMCLMYDIAYMVDDKESYGEFFNKNQTKFLRWNPESQCIENWKEYDIDDCECKEIDITV